VHGFIHQHAPRVKVVVRPAEAVSFQEQILLVTAQGWQN
jgi:hypothetical protein